MQEANKQFTIEDILNKLKEKKDKDYILKEAEMLVNSYISKVEIKDIKKDNVSQKQKNRYEKLKK